MRYIINTHFRGEVEKWFKELNLQHEQEIDEQTLLGLIASACIDKKKFQVMLVAGNNPGDIIVLVDQYMFRER